MPRMHIAQTEDLLQIVEWAANKGLHSIGSEEYVQLLQVSLGRRPVQMAHTVATGISTVSNGHLGADIIRLAAGEAFEPHTHPGDHLLIVIGGSGTITYRGLIYPTMAGQIYMIEGMEPHAVGAITDHVILAVGCPHKAVDDPDRMQVVEYTEILAEVGSLRCLICDLYAEYPNRLKDMGCPHDPTINQ